MWNVNPTRVSTRIYFIDSNLYNGLYNKLACYHSPTADTHLVNKGPFLSTVYSYDRMMHTCNSDRMMHTCNKSSCRTLLQFLAEELAK